MFAGNVLVPFFTDVLSQHQLTTIHKTRIILISVGHAWSVVSWGYHYVEIIYIYNGTGLVLYNKW